MLNLFHGGVSKAEGGIHVIGWQTLVRAAAADGNRTVDGAGTAVLQRTAGKCDRSFEKKG